jgi:signal transduction histidine kinase
MSLPPRVPLLVKIILPIAALVALTVGLSGYYIYQQANARLQRELDGRLERVARFIASNVDRGALAQIQVPGDREDPAYARIREQLELARTAGGLTWVGIYYRQGDYLYYWVDSDSLGVGYPFFHATPDHMAVFDQNQVRRIDYPDEFGSFYGFAAPLTDDRGNVIGVVEAVVLKEARQLVQREAWAGVLPIVLGGVAVVVALSLAIAHFLFGRPMRRLNTGAVALAGGQFGYQIQLPANDELGDLAATINQMSNEIERLYLERVRDERARREREIQRLQETERFLEAKVAERTAELARKNDALLSSQQELAVARDQALEASSAKSAFLAHMSHELRTPLNIIIGYTDIVKDRLQGSRDAELLSEIDQIGGSALHILHLVNDVLDLSKIEAGRMELYVETIQVPALLDEVARTVEPLVLKNNNTLIVHCDEATREIWADPTKIRQSLLNLLSNASKFTQGGTITLSASQEAAVNGGPEWIRFAVSDTGVGIAQDKLPALFQEYVQASRAGSGTGLGLAITRRFCQLMGGDITVLSEPGKGSTFTIRLPARVSPG